jgi:hypothetical protein
VVVLHKQLLYQSANANLQVFLEDTQMGRDFAFAGVCNCCIIDSLRNAPGRTRTCNLRIRSPKPQNDKCLNDKGLEEAGEGAYKPAYKKTPKTIPGLVEEIPQDLAEVAAAWPHLPYHIRAAIKALVQIGGVQGG